MLNANIFLALGQRAQMALEQLEYQIVGILVVMSCLAFLALVLAIVAKVNSMKDAKEKPAPVAAKPAPVAAPATAPASDSLTPEMVAVISAAVATVLQGMSHRIVDIKQTPNTYSSAGRQEIFASHRISPTR